MQTQRYTYAIHAHKGNAVTYKIVDLTGQEPDRLYTFDTPHAPYLGFPNAELAVGSEVERLNRKHNTQQ